MFFRKVPSVNWSEVNNSSLIIDVREKDEFKINSVSGTKNVPLSNIRNFKANSRVYVMCQSGMRSKKAVKILRSNGIDAVNIKGGIIAYGK